jgi:tetratricopeptide (TPR) repeat protein
VGTVFWTGAVASLNGVGGDLATNLDALERRDVVRARAGSAVAGEREYAFKHILIRDVAYNQLPKGRRSHLHRRFAEWTSSLPGGEDEYVEIVAYHLEQACLLAGAVARTPEPPPIDEAVAALTRAGEKAERREGIREADRFYARALGIIGDARPEKSLELRLGRARMVAAEGDLRSARPQLAEVVEEARGAGARHVLCAALVALANAHWKQGFWSEARESLDEAEIVAAEIEDRRLEAKTAFELANVRWWNEIDVAVEGVRKGLAIAEALDDRALRVEGHMRLGFGFYNLGRLDEAEAELDRCATLAQQLGSHRDEARATFQLSLVKYYRGHIEEAEELGLEALGWMERISDVYLQIQCLRALAIYALARDDAPLAEERLRTALPLALETGGWLVTEIYRYLAKALIRQGRLKDAVEITAFAARSVPEEDSYARAALLLAEAAVATASQEQAAAATAFAEALRLLEEQQLSIDLGEARIELAHALRSFGDYAGARTELERARGLFVRMGARGLTEEIDRELAGLAEGTPAA